MKTIEKNLLDTVELVKAKSFEYGKVDKSISLILRDIFPDGIPPEKYEEVIFSIRILEKLFRILSVSIGDDRKNDAFQDIVGYGLLGMAKDAKKRKKAE